MADPSRAFIRALSGVWGRDYWVTWHPSSRRALGDVGTVGPSGLVQIATLPGADAVPSGPGPGSGSDPGPAGRDSLTWYTTGAVDVTYGGTAQAAEPTGALAGAHGRAQVRFTRKNALLVAYRGLSETRLADQPRLARDLLTRYWAGDWDAGWCVVSHLVTAASGTVLMAADKGATAELAAGASLAAGPAGLADLADLAAEVRVHRSSALQCELVGRGLTPFYRVLRLRRRFLRGIEVSYGDVRGPSDRPPQVPPDILEEVEDTPEAALESPPQPVPPADDE